MPETALRTNIPEEPEIRINGKLLSTGESMTVRVAIENFATGLNNDLLSDDDHQARMAFGYKAAIVRIRDKMYA